MWNQEHVKFQILQCVFIFIGFIDIQSLFLVLWDQIQLFWVKNQICWQVIYINRLTMWDPKDVKFQILQCDFIFIGFIHIQSSFEVLCDQILVGWVKNVICWQLGYINRRNMWDPKDVKYQILQCVLIFHGFIDIQSSFWVLWDQIRVG